MLSSRVRIHYCLSHLSRPSATHGRFSRGTVNNLNEIRQDEVEHTQNRLDTTLADVFSLLSLFFLTIGRTKECPAIYCQIASMRVSNRMWIFTLAPRRRPTGVHTADALFLRLVPTRSVLWNSTFRFRPKDEAIQIYSDRGVSDWSHVNPIHPRKMPCPSMIYLFLSLTWGTVS